MYNLQDWAAVQSLHDRGYPIRAIARELGMSRNTVRKLLKEKEEPHYHRTFYRSVIDGYKETIYKSWIPGIPTYVATMKMAGKPHKY